MSISLEVPSTFTSANKVPTPNDVKQISQLADPTIRNLSITQCYCELSKAFSVRTGTTANWCTFATWASKQAGVTIRGEDMQRTMERALQEEPLLKSILSEVATYTKTLGSNQSHQEIHRRIVSTLVRNAAAKASDAVARGNCKVFEEIGYEFARFISTCFADKEYNGATIDGFCRQLRDGDPPEGQAYLKRAFHRYYLSFFETDHKKKQEMQLQSNVEIGFHEQTRLQPEILESLNAALVDAGQVKTFVQTVFLTNMGVAGNLILLVSVLRGKKSLLNRSIEKLVTAAAHHLRKFITAALMTLTIPPDRCLQLGRDLQATFPDNLQQLSSAELIEFLARIDPTPDSLQGTAATDWATLPERLHYIVDLFRCFHQKEELFENAFSEEQVASIKAGKIPVGKL